MDDLQVNKNQFRMDYALNFRENRALLASEVESLMSWVVFLAMVYDAEQSYRLQNW